MSPFARKIAANSYIYSAFSYCPLVWHFCPGSSTSKIEKIGKKAHKFLDSESVFTSFEIKRLRLIATEIFKTLNNINPPYMKEIFKKKSNRSSLRFGNNLQCTGKWYSSYAKNSLSYLGPILWNFLPHEVKSIKRLSEFKGFINSWGIPGCPYYEKFVNYMNS